MDTTGTAALVERARDGDDGAWRELVERYTPLMQSIARRHRLSDDDAADIVQTAWMRAFCHLDRIADGARLVGWLATTVRRESWRVSGRRAREVPVAEELEWVEHPGPNPEVVLVLHDLGEQAWRAVEDLPERQRCLIQVLMSDPAPSYDEIASTLDMPIGSIGPTRARALAHLRRDPRLAEPSFAA